MVEHAHEDMIKSQIERFKTMINVELFLKSLFKNIEKINSRFPLKNKNKI